MTPPVDAPDRRDGLVYVMTSRLELAVKVSLATGRPLLLRGDPGTGKSSLAAYIARRLGWRYYEHVVTSQTQARDLLWTFDGVRRLADAQAGIRAEGAAYVEPGAMWWALAPESARHRGRRASGGDPAVDPFQQVNEGRSPDHAVVLIDEIDKAEPDLPNALLVPLSSSSFVVTETHTEVSKAPSRTENGATARHLVVITTNEERELPEAFLRRCVVVWLEPPDENRLMQIAEQHMTTYDGAWSDDGRQLAREVAKAVVVAREVAAQQGIRPASTAEFLDALRACRALGIRPGTSDWRLLAQFVLFKPQQPTGDGDGRHLA